MARGKYAAKANGQRADVASNEVVALRGQVDQMRRDHTAECAGLKAEISALKGRLLRETRVLAAAEVQRARAESRSAIEAERAASQERMRRVAQLLKDGGRDHMWWAEVADTLGVPLLDVMPNSAENREARRFKTSQLRELESRADGWQRLPKYIREADGQ